MDGIMSAENGRVFFKVFKFLPDPKDRVGFSHPSFKANLRKRY